MRQTRLQQTNPFVIATMLLKKIRPIPLVPKPHFWTFICPYNDIVSTKIYNKRDDLDFAIVNFPFLDVDVSSSTSYRDYISKLIRFATASSHVADFKILNKLLTQKLLKQG